MPTSRRRAPAVPLEHRPVALAPRGPPAWCTQVNTTQTRGNVSKRLAGRNRLKPQARPSPLSAPTPHPRPHLVTHGLVAHFQEQRGGLGRRVTQQRRVGKPTKALWTRSPLIDPGPWRSNSQQFVVGSSKPKCPRAALTDVKKSICTTPEVPIAQGDRCSTNNRRAVLKSGHEGRSSLA